MGKSNATPRDDGFGPARVVILAGGYGTRLAEQTNLMPKPMVEIGGMPILWHILKIYSHFGFNDFMVACGYKAELIKQFFLAYREQHTDFVVDYVQDSIVRLSDGIEPWRIGLVDTGLDTMTGGRLGRLGEHLRDRTFMMTYGDGVGDIDIRKLYEFHKSHGKLATLTTVRRPSQFGHMRFEGDLVRVFEEKPEAADWINGGFFVLEPAVLDLLEGDPTIFEQHTLPRLASDGQLVAFRHEGFWKPMDTLRDVRSLNSMWAEPDPPWKVWT